MPKTASPPGAAAAPPPRRKRRPSDQVRAQLLAAGRAEFERAGYAGATTAAIASGAEATEAQLFRYFRSKAELFHAAVLDPINVAFEGFNAARLAGPSTDEGWAAETQRYIADLSAFIGEHSHLLMSLVVAQAYGGAKVEGVAGVGGLKAYFDLGADTMRGHIRGRARVEPALMVRVSFGAVLASVLFRDWLFSNVGASDEEITTALSAFVRDGIGVNHADPPPGGAGTRRKRKAAPIANE